MMSAVFQCSILFVYNAEEMNNGDVRNEDYSNDVGRAEMTVQDIGMIFSSEIAIINRIHTIICFLCFLPAIFVLYGFAIPRRY